MHSRIVQSRQNRRVKQLRAGFSRSGRSEDGLISVEGEHLLAEAVRSNLPIAAVFYRRGDEAILQRFELPAGTEILELPPDVFLSAVITESPQGVAALVEPRLFSLDHILRAPSPLLIIAASLQDPGNFGTLIRSAEAFGAAGVVTLPGTVSLWNAKTLRASSGSAFRLPVVAAREAELFPLLKDRGIRLLAAVAGASLRSQDLRDWELKAATAILIGNEGSGLSAAILDRADGCITIPCPGPVESLNAAVAGSVLLYEAARQRGII